MKMKDSTEYEEWKKEKKEQDEYQLWRIEQDIKQIPTHLQQSFKQNFGEKHEFLR